MKLSVFFLDILHVMEQEKISLREAVLKVRELGFSGVDIEGCELDAYPDAVNIIHDAGMAFSNVYGIYDLVNGKYDDATELIDHAVNCGAKVAMLIPGSFVAGEIPDPARKSEDVMSDFLSSNKKSLRALSAIRKTAKYAQERGVTLTVESFGDINSLTAYTAEIKWLLDNISELKFTFDIGNFYLNGEDVCHAYSKLSDKTVHVHCKDYLTVPPVGHKDFSYQRIAASIGGGAAPTEKIVRELLACGYDGYFTVEYLYAENDLKALRESAEYLNSIG